MLTPLRNAEFQSTPSARRATCGHPRASALPSDFNPRPPRGGRPSGIVPLPTIILISIHALREEGDLHAGDPHVMLYVISIHALREEGDFRSSHAPPAWETFQSTPSARRATDTVDDSGQYYAISIHALREEGDQVRCNPFTGKDNFNPRPPRGGRLIRECISFTLQYFNPRPPRGGRPDKVLLSKLHLLFQSTPSARRATV